MNIVDERRLAAKILVDLLLGKVSALNALKMLPKDSQDPSVNVCFHIIAHFEADEDLRKKDAVYKETQDDFLVDAAEILAKGEALPYNIIEDYMNYYGVSDLIYHKVTKENLLKRLLKTINI